MIDQTLAEHYSSIESDLPVEADPQYSDLVVPNGNIEQPIHRWFHMKEAFSSRLLPKILHETALDQRKSLRLLDPFAGVGTSLISALLTSHSSDRRVEAYGIERNPFLRFVAETKCRAIVDGPDSFGSLVKELMEQEQSLQAQSLPSLTTFHNRTYFPEGPLIELLSVRDSIEAADASKLDKDLARLCVAACIEPVSRLRKDGRALRFEANKTVAQPRVEFSRRAELISLDIASVGTVKASAHVYLGDGRRPDELLPNDAQFDLILFSPPYPNNIDYTEVYKLEAWFLGFIRDQLGFRAQRLLTLRSHPSVRFADRYETSSNGYRLPFATLLAPLLQALPASRDMPWRRRLVLGYFDDMLQTLIHHRRFLAHDGWLVYVVGNSLHGSGKRRFLIASDLLIARLAQMAGYEVKRLVVSRQPKRKSADLPLLRESVVFLQRLG